jgi:hypothetical protein
MTKLQRTCLKTQPDKSGGSPRAMPQGAFCIMQQVATRKKARKKSRKITKSKPRPAIEPTRLYDRNEAAHICGVSWPTLFRAYDNGHLKAYRVGARVQHSGQHLLDWLEAGGKTGRTAEDVRREKGGKNNLAG